MNVEYNTNLVFSYQNVQYTVSLILSETCTTPFHVKPYRISQMKTRTVDNKTDDPEAREQGREPKEQKRSVSESYRDVRLNAECIADRTRVRPLQPSRHRRPRRTRRQHKVSEHLLTLDHNTAITMKRVKERV